MSFHFIDALFIVMILLIIWGAKWVKPFTGLNDKYLSKENCNAVRGIFALTPMLVHIANFMEYSAPVGWWTQYGNGVVEGFFFLSGFGLMKQHINRDGYSKGFLTKRYPKILLPYLLATLCYWAGDFVFLGFLYSPADVIHAILCGVPIVTFSWYIIHLLLFYLFFYLMMVIFKKHYIIIAFGGIVYYIITSLVFYNAGFGAHWYETSLGLALGMFWALYEDRIFAFMQKYYWQSFAAVIALTVLIYFKLGDVTKYIVPDDFPLRNAVVFSFMCIVIIMALMKYELGNPVSRFLGKYSFEIYLYHGFAITALRNDRIYIADNAVFAICVIALTLAISVAANKITEVIFKLIHSAGNNHKEQAGRT